MDISEFLRLSNLMFFLMSHHFFFLLKQYNNVPRTPLLSIDSENISEAKDNINNALNELRIQDNLIVIKSLNEADNPLLIKRRHNQEKLIKL
jgi:hypothetical protein